MYKNKKTEGVQKCLNMFKTFSSFSFCLITLRLR